MPSATDIRPAGTHRLTPHDACRSYVLRDEVETNVPRRGHLGSLGVHNWARGHLVELYIALGGTPLSLHYRELLARGPHEDDTVPEHLPVGCEVTARLRTDDGQVITVVSRTESAPYGPRGDHWQLTVDGEIPVDDDPRLDGVGTHPPSLPFLGVLVRLHLRRIAAPATAR
ncbi:hypothetical protein [Amycolatopsis sp. cg9]|uniref:hypothetical protein n=1 Tax=Amycolatopsis sp. cg9 TaxID=3238801 RepID=UPI00352538C6